MTPTDSRARQALSRAGRALRPLAPVGTALVMALALWLVWRALKETPPARIAAALAATPPLAVIASAACTAASFAGLATGEWTSFWAAARRLPAGPAARSSLTATALSAVMGFGLASGPALRARLYRWSGLGMREIVGASLLVSASVYLSGVVALGLCVLADTGRFAEALGWPRAAAAGCGAALLTPAVLWLTVLRSPEGPGAAWRLTALAAALGDWLFSGLALFVLVRQPLADLPAFMAVFCLGSLAGGIAGAPASLGVLDAAVLHLHAGGAVHETAAALILYRAIYFLAPLLLAGCWLLARFVGRRWRPGL